ncbi:MAG: heparinase II/III domain-containing protein, partial [Isosphaeraceae bacterium]
MIFARVHHRNLRVMSDAAWAYAITGDERFAALATQVLVGYGSRYRDYLYHDSGAKTGKQAGKSGGRLFEQTLDEASALAEEIAPAYDLIRDSKSLSAEDHRVIRQGLLRPMLKNIAKHKAGKSNWQTWHNAAMLWGGAVLGDLAWVRTAIEDPANGFLFQMRTSVSADGMWYENSWGYHFYTLAAMVKIVEGARRLGIDLWGHPALKRMFTVPIEYAMPDGSLPRFGDDVRTTVSQASRMLEFAYHAYRDPAMLPFLPRQTSWDSVMFGRTVSPPPRPGAQASKLFPSAGHAILRTEGEKGLTAALTFGPYGGFHGHLDKLSFVLFGYGRELGVDPGRAKSQAYRLPIHTRWYKATLGHNAMLVDGRSQKPAAGKLECFATSGPYTAVVARCDEAYPGVRHRRLLCLTPDYLLVFDDLAAETSRRFDWVYHNRGP